MNRKSPRIFLGLQEIAGYYTNLQYGFSKIGIKSTFINLEPQKFKYNYESKLNPFWANLINYYFQEVHSGLLQNKIYQYIWEKYLNVIVRLTIFILVLLHYDVVIFSFGNSFFHLKDLKLLKKFQKKIIFSFHGSDARPSYADGFIFKGSSFTEQDLQNLKIRKHALSIIEQIADYVVIHPPIAYLFTKPIVQSVMIGLPYKIKARHTLKNERKSPIVRIVHSPSDPFAKGTEIIRKAIQTIKNRGYKIDYIEMINKPNSEVLKVIAECDFIVDQIYSDTPLAGFGVEAASFGKPAIECSYDVHMIRKILHREYCPPSMYVHPDRLVDSIEKLIKDKKYRLKLGQKAREFVRTKWRAEVVAKHYLSLVDSKLGKEWFFDPNKIRYVYGGGISKGRLKENIKSLINDWGLEALQLKDKPELEKLFVQVMNE